MTTTPQRRQKYNLWWNEPIDDLEIEMAMIRAGGRWQDKKTGVWVGKGLYEHYRNTQMLLWPDDDMHRWSDLALKRICENEIVVFMGSGDSNKTYSVSRFVLTDWWVFASNTLWMVSSTELRGAELRIWGTLKQLFNRARERHPWLPGTVLESKHCITSEEISDDGSEARLLTKGIIFLPCKTGNSWVGMGAYAGVKPTKNGRLGHAGDECFVAGTMVDTPNGKIPIESIVPGDSVVNASGISLVKGITSKHCKALVNILTKDGRIFSCTYDHPFFTQKGWIKACHLNQSHYMMSPYESMQILRERNSEQNFLQLTLQREMEDNPRRQSFFLYKGERTKDNLSQTEVASGSSRTICCDCVRDEKSNSRKRTGEKEIVERIPKEDRMGTYYSRGQWDRTNEGRAEVGGLVSGWNLELRSKNRQVEWKWNTPSLQSRFRISRNKTGNRSPRKLSQSYFEKIGRHKKEDISRGTWVDSVSFYEHPNTKKPGDNEDGYRVYNLQVEGHPSYSVNGILVHNCSFMANSFLDAYANWYGKENFKGLLTGNPTDLEDPLCVAGEPVDGWENWKDSEKTQEWRSRFYNAWVIAFDGRDSPNFDPPVKSKPRFPYLVGPKKLEAVASVLGKDSALWWMQCVGKPRLGAEKLKVITRQLCEQGMAFDTAVWQGAKPTSVVGLDAAYGGVGGDRCVLMRIRFGTDVENRNILCFDAPVIVPVSVRNLEIPEDQISRFCMAYCSGLDIPPEHFFFDARSSLAVSLARIWSPQVNVVDFGGPATERPVSMDEYVWEGETQTRRLRKCNEAYSKFVTELWFAVNRAILSKQIRQLPKDVAAEGYKRQWRYTKGTPPRIEIETKAEMKERTNYSPDLFDASVIAVEGARRLGFVIENLKEPKAQENDQPDWLTKEIEKHKRVEKKLTLSYK